MSTVPIIVALTAAACYFGWSALQALRSGDITLYVRASRQRYFSRRPNPAAYWVAVCRYLAFAAVGAAGLVIRAFWP
jgi:hypothetical protein